MCTTTGEEVRKVIRKVGKVKTGRRSKCVQWSSANHGYHFAAAAMEVGPHRSGLKFNRCQEAFCCVCQRAELCTATDTDCRQAFTCTDEEGCLRPKACVLDASEAEVFRYNITFEAALPRKSSQRQRFMKRLRTTLAKCTHKCRIEEWQQFEIDEGNDHSVIVIVDKKAAKQLKNCGSRLTGTRVKDDTISSLSPVLL